MIAQHPCNSTSHIFSTFSLVANLQAGRGSKAFAMASVWTGVIHLCLGILGTFVLKRFPTSFSVGFLLGVLAILANQNLLLFGTFRSYPYGNSATNRVFATIGFILFLIMSLFSLLVFHFKSHIIVAPIDVKHGARTPVAATTDADNYQKYDEAA
jgi:hypothetical protein